MRAFVLFCLVAVFASLASWAAAAPTAITACGAISSAGHYNLTTNLNVSNDSCLNVTVPNVILDCDGFIISGNGSSSETGHLGVYVNSENNVTIRNCRIQNVSTGIRVSMSSNVTIYNNTFFNNTHHGVRIDQVPNNSTIIFNNTFSYNGQTGIRANANGSLIYNNLFYNQSSYHVYLAGGSGSNVTNNTMYNGSSSGIRTDAYTNDTYIFNNTIYNQTKGIELINSFRAYVHNNTLYNNSNYGIQLQSGAYNNVSNNSISNHSSQTAVRANTGENFTRVESNVLYNNAGGVHVINGINFTIRNNTVTFTGASNGILLQTFSHNHTVANNTLRNFTSQAILIQSSSHDNYVLNNNITNGVSANGIALGGALASNNTVSLNNVSFVDFGITVDNASYNNFSDNRIVNASSTGISFNVASHWNLASNNTIINTTAGMGTGQLSSNNTFVSNNISFTFGNGVQFSNGSYNNASYNRIENTTNAAIRIETLADWNVAADNVIVNTTDTSGAWGVLVINRSAFNRVLRNVINDTVGGIQLDDNVTNNTFQDNQVRTSSSYGVYLQRGANDNIFDNNTVTGSLLDGLRLDSASGNLFAGGFITDNAVGSGNQTRFLNGSTGIQLANVTISGSGSHVSVNGSSSVTIINATLNESLVQGELGAFNITLRWYFTVRALDFDGDGLQSINVTVTNNTPAVDQFGATNLSSSTVFGGFVYYQLVSEAFINSSGTTNTSAYNVTVSRASPYNSSQIRYNSTLANITLADQAITLQSNALPNVTINGPASGSFNSSRNLTVSFNVIDSDNATYRQCWAFSNETAWGPKAANTTTVSNGSNTNIVLNFSSDGDFLFNVQCFDNANESAFASSNFTVSIDNTTPSAITYVSPTLSNGSTSILNYSEVNVTFTESLPDTCLLEYDNGTAVNYSMTRSANVCSYNLTLLNNGDFNFSVYVNDTLGHLNQSDVRYVTLSDDLTSPSAIVFVSPTLANASTSLLNYSEVNVSFVEDVPDVCLLEYNNGSAVNYSMTRSGSSCFYNLTVFNNGDFNYSVYVNDTGGLLNRSDVRFVTLSDDSTPPSVSLVSPANGVTLSGTPLFVFNFADAVSSTAACSLWTDSVISAYNGSVNNATATTLSTNVSLTSTGHSWFVQCTDENGNSANASANSFLLAATGGSSSTPTTAPTPTPVPSVAPTSMPAPSPMPVPTSAPTLQPTVQPSVAATVQPTPEPFVVLEEEVVVEVVEPVGTGLGSSGEPAAAPKVTVRQAVSGPGLSGRGNAVRSTFAVTLENKGDQSLSNVEVTQRLPFVTYRGPSPDDYPDIEWNPRPIRIESGSAVVTWLFDEVKPGQEVKAEAGFKEQDVSKDDVAALAAPKVLAQSVRSARTGPAQASVQAQATPAVIDWTVPAVIVLLLLAGGAYFLTRRKNEGL